MRAPKAPQGAAAARKLRIVNRRQRVRNRAAAFAAAQERVRNAPGDVHARPVHAIGERGGWLPDRVAPGWLMLPGPVTQVRNNLNCGNTSGAFRGNRQMTRQKNRHARERGFETFERFFHFVMARADAQQKAFIARSRGWL